MNENITLKIDNREISVPKGTTILEAARDMGIDIPTLCYMNLKDLCIKNAPASCRLCVVEVEGRKNLAPSCATRCENGMNVHTNTIRVLNARRTVLELMLSDHPSDCLVCAKSGNCELQSVAIKLGIREIPFEGEKTEFRVDLSPSIRRDATKCIYCRRCEMMCNEVQTVGALSAINRGFSSVVMPAFDQSLQDSECTFCGQCVAVCPVGALTELDHTNRLIKDLADPDKTVIVQTAPAVRAALGEEFALPAGTSVTGKMVAALRKLGFAKVFDTDFAADLTIMEEGTELIDRLNNGGVLPMITSCSPGWIKYCEHYYPEFIPNLSSCKSPHEMTGAMVKTYYADKAGIDPQNIVVVSVMPCTAKKFEARRPELGRNGMADVDVVITTRELARMIKEAGIDFVNLPDEDFDSLMGESTGAGVIFGATGGVMEAALRTAYELITGTTLEDVNFTAVRGMEGIKEATVKIGDLDVKVAVCSSTGKASELLDAVKRGEKQYHFIEVMGCPGGCVNGGGQPIVPAPVRNWTNVPAIRAKALYSEDEAKTLRKSHENPEIKQIYEEFLGKPNSHKAHMLLHTTYEQRDIYL